METGFDSQTEVHSLIAQLAEHEAVNFGVPGSSPGGGVGSDPAITSRALLPIKPRIFLGQGDGLPCFGRLTQRSECLLYTQKVHSSIL